MHGEMLEALRDGVRTFLAGDVAPLVDPAERDRAVPREVVEGLGKLDFLGAGLGEPFGAGLGTAGDVVLLEELARHWGSLAVSVLPTLVASPLLAASPQAWDRWGEAVVSGRAPVAVVTARSGRIHGVVNGSIAELLVVCPHPSAGAPASPRVLLRGDWQIEAVPQLDVVRAADVASIRLLGEPEGVGGSLPPVSGGVVAQRRGVLVAAVATGLAGAALDLAVQYAKDRRQFGRPIAHFGEIYGMLARAYVDVRAGSALVREAADGLDRGDADEAMFRAASVYCADTALEVTTRAQHVHGGYGHMTEFAVGRSARDARFAAALSGVPAEELRGLAGVLGLVPAEEGES